MSEPTIPCAPEPSVVRTANDRVEVTGNLFVEWRAAIYDDGQRTSITIDLEHVRAADGIRIQYESDRDGWVIQQAAYFEWATATDVDEDWQEVAFVQAWAREATHPSLEESGGLEDASSSPRDGKND